MDCRVKPGNDIGGWRVTGQPTHDPFQRADYVAGSRRRMQPSSESVRR
jgi:hypothetical protein